MSIDPGLDPELVLDDKGESEGYMESKAVMSVKSVAGSTEMYWGEGDAGEVNPL